MDSLGRQKGKNQKGPVAANPGACLYRNPLPKLASSAACMPVSGSATGQGREEARLGSALYTWAQLGVSVLVIWAFLCQMPCPAPCLSS